MSHLFVQRRIPCITNLTANNSCQQNDKKKKERGGGYKEVIIVHNVLHPTCPLRSRGDTHGISLGGSSIQQTVLRGNGPV